MIKLVRIDKDSLSVTHGVDVELANTTGATISHYVGAERATSSTLPFVIEGVQAQVPTIGDTEFAVVIRKRVDFTAVGPNQETTQKIEKDTGTGGYKDRLPRRPYELPPGFKEKYK